MSDRTGGAGGLDLYVATRATRSSPWGPALPFIYRSIDDEHQPSLSADGLELYFTKAGPADRDIWVSTRSLPTELWGAPGPVSEVNPPLDDGSPAVSGDGTRLMLARRSLGGTSPDWWTYRRGGLGQPWGLFRTGSSTSPALRA